MTSKPASPFMTSLPSPLVQTSVSSPPPPLTVSSPRSPRMRSGPSPVRMLSLPGPESMLMAIGTPGPVVTVSSPEKDCSESFSIALEEKTLKPPAPEVRSKRVTAPSCVIVLPSSAVPLDDQRLVDAGVTLVGVVAVAVVPDDDVVAGAAVDRLGVTRGRVLAGRDAVVAVAAVDQVGPGRAGDRVVAVAAVDRRRAGEGRGGDVDVVVAAAGVDDQVDAAVVRDVVRAGGRDLAVGDAERDVVGRVVGRDGQGAVGEGRRHRGVRHAGDEGERRDPSGDRHRGGPGRNSSKSRLHVSEDARPERAIPPPAPPPSRAQPFEVRADVGSSGDRRPSVRFTPRTRPVGVHGLGLRLERQPEAFPVVAQDLRRALQPSRPPLAIAAWRVAGRCANARRPIASSAERSTPVPGTPNPSFSHAGAVPGRVMPSARAQAGGEDPSQVEQDVAGERGVARRQRLERVVAEPHHLAVAHRPDADPRAGTATSPRGRAPSPSLPRHDR